MNRISAPVGFMAGELTRAVAAIGLQGSALSLPDEPLPSPVWRQLLSETRFHRVVGLLAAAVHDGLLPAEPEQVDEVRGAHATSMAMCLALEADLLAAAAVLDRAGVEYRVLKGSAFAHLDYPDPSQRVFADVDLLVGSARYDDAVAALTDAGYVRRYEEVRTGFDHRFGKGASFKGPGRRELDLHRTFVMGPFGLTVVLSDLWATASAFEVGGRRSRPSTPRVASCTPVSTPRSATPALASCPCVTWPACSSAPTIPSMSTASTS